MNRFKFIELAFALAALTLPGCKSNDDAAATTGSSREALSAPAREIELLNVSYDPTRELWREVNEKFSASYQKETGTKLTIKQSHGGSSTQARSVIDGLDADV